MNRQKTIIRTSIIGIATNILLSIFKVIVGLVSHSIAIVLDAVNNLSDALSSVITIVGTKLAAKDPDKQHPFGYGRIEYMSALIISAIVLYAGITSFVESIKKIIEPEIPSYTAPTLIIVFVGVIVKILLGRYTEAVGKKVDSHSLVDSGKDALNDAILSFSTLIAALFFLWQKISLEAYLGVIISVFIVKSGVEMLKETLQRILGERADSDLAKAIKATTCSIEGVEGAYDLVLHDYGPENTVGSVHVEVSEKLSAKEIDLLERKIKDKVLQEHSVFLEAISIYAQNEGNPEVIRMRDEVKDILFKHQGVIQMHGFYLNQKEKTMQFDVVVDFDCDRPKQRFNEAVEAVKKQYPEYTITAAYDRDTSD